MLQYANLGRSLMHASVAVSTSAHYQVGWNAWTAFAATVGQSPYPSASLCMVLSNNVAVPLTIALASHTVFVPTPNTAWV